MSDSHHHTKLTAPDRDLIAVWRGAGLSLRAIARELGRSHSTIIDEIRRNSFRDAYRTHYVAIHAHAKAITRARASRRRHPLKDDATFAYVIDKLRRGWSPEVIAGRLRKRFGRTILAWHRMVNFTSQEDRSYKLSDFVEWYNAKKGHSSLDGETPFEFLVKHLKHCEKCTQRWQSYVKVSAI